MKMILKRKKKELLTYDIILIAAIITVVASLFILPKIEKNTVNTTEIDKHYPTTDEIFHDINFDGEPEHFRLNEPKGYPEITFTTSEYSKNLILSKPFFYRYLYFADIDNNNVEEIFFLAQSNDSVFVNVLEYDGELRFLVENRFIDTINKNHFDKFDGRLSGNLFFFDTNADGCKEFIFHILAEYSFQPRNFFSFDIKNDTVKKSPQNGAYFTGGSLFDFDNDSFPEIYTTTYATSNILDAGISCNYPDTSAWLMILDKNFDYLFPPIEFKGAGSQITVQPLQTGDSTYIAAFYTNERFKKNPVLYLFDNNGKFLRRKQFNISEYNLLRAIGEKSPDFSSIYLYDFDGYVYRIDKEFNTRKMQVTDTDEHGNFFTKSFDINNDGDNELIYIDYKGFKVFNNDMNYMFDYEFSTPDFHKPSAFYINKVRHLMFKNGDNTCFTINYTANTWYPYRYLFSICIFAVLYMMFFGLKKLWLQKLQTDNIKLNKIIERRTAEISVQNKQLAIQNKKLRQNDEFRQALTAMLVHDLKNPLTAIISLTKNTLTDKIPQLEAYSQQMLSLVMNILDTQKYEHSKINITASENLVYKCAVRAIRKVEIFAQNRNIKIINNINSTHTALFDFYILERVFINIISNAIKYTHDDTEVEIKSTISIQKGKKHCHISIIDMGDGIPEKFMDTIFDKYTTAYKRKSNYSTGLGLYYCKLMIEAHGGKIGVKSPKNRGAEFWFILPATNNTIQMIEENSPVEINELNLSEMEKKTISDLCKRFQGIKFYEITKLNDILNQIETSNVNIQKWKNMLQQTVEYGNEQKFNELVNL